MGLPLRVGRLHHVGVAVPDIATAAWVYREILGLALSTEVVVEAALNVKVAFAKTTNGLFVEFVEPLGPDSPVCRFAARGQGLYHVCFVVPDIESAVTQAREGGALLVSPPVPAKAFGGRRVAFIYLPGGSLVEFLEE